VFAVISQESAKANIYSWIPNNWSWEWRRLWI